MGFWGFGVGPLLITWHTYDESGKHFLKETHWYSMEARGDQALVPQQEVHITELKWVGPEELADFTSQNSLPSSTYCGRVVASLLKFPLQIVFFEDRYG